MKIAGKTFEVNNKEKVFYPAEKYTKQDIMEYYQKISPYILPHIKNRPLTMLRYPDGIKGKKFFQKNTPDYFPEWISTKKLPKKEGGEVEYILGNEEATLVYLASQACVTPHIWLSKIENPNKPDKLIFDLDPSDEDFSKVKTAAQIIREFFRENFKIQTYVMTTGSTGLHVVIPIKPEVEFDKVLKISQKTAQHLADLYPEKLTAEVRKNKRENKIYVDVMRNAYGQTAVAPYSLRARPKAPVATPLDWKELKKLTSAQQYNLANIFKRLGKKEDPWKNIYQNPVKVEKLIKEIEDL